MAIEQLTNGNPDGSLIGRSDDKLGFYGLTTPIVKPTLTLTTGTTTANNYSDSLAIKAVLVALGLIA
jgi:hypothetical protein